MDERELPTHVTSGLRENKVKNMLKPRLVAQIPDLSYDKKGWQDRLHISEREPIPRTVQEIIFEENPRGSTLTKRLKKSLEASDDGKFWIESLSGGLHAEFVGIKN